MILRDEYRWWRVAVFAVAFMLIPTILQSGWDAYWKNYYQTADISEFYQAVSMTAEDACIGELVHDVVSIRYVYGTETGWQADIVRELDKIENGVGHKVWEQDTSVFIERVPDGIVYRNATLPELDEGVYQWRIHIVRLYLPYGVERVSIPALVSNQFVVTLCNNN